MGPRAATAFIAVVPDFSPLHKGVAAESAGLSKKGNLLGKSIAAGIGAGLVAGGGLFKIGEAFDTEADKIRVGTGKTGKALKGLQKDFKAVVQDVPADFDSAGTAITGLSQRLDLTGKPLRRLTKQVTELSRITGSDVGENVESLTRLFGDWSIKTDKQSGTLDKLFRLSQRTGIGISDLSRFMVQFGSPLRQLGLDFDFSAAMFARFEKEGVNIQTLMPGLRFALKTFSKEGREPAKALRETFEAIENAAGAAEANQLAFETFGVRAGPDMAAAIREGRFDLDEMLRSMRRGKDTVLGAAEDTKDLSERWIEFRNRALVKLEPVATRVFNRVGDEADKLFDILENPRLTTDEKIERIAGRLSDGIAKALPILADRAAEMAPKAAEAFVKGWLGAGVWGRLIIGGFLLKKMGGVPAFMRLGTTAGGAMGAGMATGVAGSGLKGKLTGMLRGWGPLLAVGAAATLGPELAKRVRESLREATPKGRAELEFNEARQGAKSFDQLVASIQRTGGELRKGVRYSNQMRVAVGSLQEQGADTAREFSGLSKETLEVADRIRRMGTDSSRSVKELRTRVSYNTKQIKRVLGEDTQAGKDALSKNFAAAARNVRRSMKEGTISTKRGTALIEEYMVKALQNMGFSKADAIALRKRTPGSTQAPKDGQLRPNQRGSYIDVGKATGDSVPSLLERGEYVLNRKAVKKIGRAALDKINFGIAPRFQTGGIVELLHPGNDPEGHGDHLHVAMSTYAAIVALGRKLQRMGWLVGEHPAFGGGHLSGHSPTGYHPRGLAIDVNWPDASQERAKIAALLPMLGGSMAGLGGIAPKIAKVIATGPDSPLKSLVQAAFDTTHAAAQDVVNRAATPLEGAEMTGFSGSWVRVLEQIAQSRGWSAADWKRLVDKESGGDPTAVNPSSGAFGLGQFLGSTKDAYAKHGATSTDPVMQIQAMARYISDRYGSPSAALAFHNANNWYAKGGLVGRMHDVLRRFGTVDKKGRGVLDRKQRGKLLGKFLKRIKGIGLPGRLEKRVATLTRDAEIAGDFAARAGTLTFEGPNGEQLLGQVNGLTEADYLSQQLEALFKLRNKLVEAQDVVVRKREAMTRLIESAQKRLGRVAESIRTAAKLRRGLERQLETARKKPKQNRELIKSLRGKISGIDRDQAVRGRERNALKERILPALGGRRSKLNTSRGDILSALEDVQGVGSPMGKLGSLPAPGVLGGTILDVQMRLRELNQPREAVTDTSTDDRGFSAADALELVRQSELRTAVYDLQKSVFQNMPPFGGSFADGGVVPGPVGAPRTIIAHGGEVVSDGAGRQVIQVIVQDGAVDPNKIRVVASDEVQVVLRRESRNAGRGLAGAGGGNW